MRGAQAAREARFDKEAIVKFFRLVGRGLVASFLGFEPYKFRLFIDLLYVFPADPAKIFSGRAVRAEPLVLEPGRKLRLPLERDLQRRRPIPQ